MRTWNDCVAFHGHACGGLTIGYKAALYAIELLGLTFSKDEEVVCIAENDACGVDAIQVMLGCSVGKGNLILRVRGKQAFNVFNRSNGDAVRLLLRPAPAGLAKEESFTYYQSRDPRELFDVKPVTLALPEKARLFRSFVCDGCGEVTGGNWGRLRNGKNLCLDCYDA